MRRNSFKLAALVLTSFFMVQSCKDEVNIADSTKVVGSSDEAKVDADNTPTSDTPVKNYLNPQITVTWQDDILPFLQSDKAGEKYQCITCHTDFTDEATVRRLVPKIIDSFRATGKSFMPRIGDRVPDSSIVMFARWQRGGQPLSAVPTTQP